MAKKPRALTPRQLAFVDAYMRSGNATQAYAEVYGRSDKVSNVLGSKALANVGIAAEIADRKRDSLKRAQIDTAWVVKQLVKNVRKASAAIPVLDKQGEPTGEYRYDGATVNGALSMLAKYTGGFAERHTFTVERLAQMTDAELEQVAQGKLLPGGG